MTDLAASGTWPNPRAAVALEATAVIAAGVATGSRVGVEPVDLVGVMLAVFFAGAILVLSQGFHPRARIMETALYAGLPLFGVAAAAAWLLAPLLATPSPLPTVGGLVVAVAASVLAVVIGRRAARGRAAL